jgi:ParB family chromosome partitioning protein
MARKNLLEGLMGATPPAPPAETDRPRYAKGAIGAISRSVADLQARALIDIDPHLIEAGGVQDRLESDAAEDDALRASIAEYGQQVPVLVRPHPDKDGRYQIVYGRRRVLALRDLSRPVRALVRQLDDRDLLIAQGQENTARRDLSFIEKANFARQMVEAGYDRKVIGDTLSMDKTLISRLISVIERVPFHVIETIGAAPSIGRDRWLALAEGIETYGHQPHEVAAMINLSGAVASDDRFEAALTYVKGSKRRHAKPLPTIQSVNGTVLAEIQRSGGRLTLRFEKQLNKDFQNWLIQQIPELHRKWGVGE